MPFRYVKVKPLRRTPPFRKVALGTWSGPGDPQIYGILDVDLTKTRAWMQKQEQESGQPIRLLPVVTRVMALVMEKYPDLNGFIRFGKIYLREDVDIFIQVATEHESGRMDLSGIQLTEVNRKSVTAIATEIQQKVQRVREKRDTAIQKTARMMQLLPGFMMRGVLGLVGFISYTLNLRFPGIPKDVFGACMITNIGSFGLDMAFAPLVPYSRVPVIIALGQAKKRPVVIDDQIQAREILRLNATIDHRFCDGALIAQMAHMIEECFDNPEKYFG